MSMEKDDLPIGVGFVLLDDCNRILFGKRRGNVKGAGSWSLIGGRMKRGENIEDTAQRELNEELGIIVEKDDVNVINISVSIDSDGTQYFLIGTIIKNWKGQIKNMEPDKCSELKFFSKKRLPKDIFYPTKSILDLYLAGLFYDPKFNTKNADLVK